MKETERNANKIPLMSTMCSTADYQFHEFLPSEQAMKFYNILL